MARDEYSILATIVKGFRLVLFYGGAIGNSTSDRSSDGGDAKLNRTTRQRHNSRDNDAAISLDYLVALKTDSSVVDVEPPKPAFEVHEGDVWTLARKIAMWAIGINMYKTILVDVSGPSNAHGVEIDLFHIMMLPRERLRIHDVIGAFLSWMSQYGWLANCPRR